MESTLADKIKSRGYWRIIIRPPQFKKDLIPSLDECLRLIVESKVSLRGWDYPHVAREGEGLANGLDWVESSTEWGEILEYWRFYQSGQFAHLFSCEGDWVDRSQIKVQRLQRSQPLPGGILDIIEIIYRTTEIYEFAARLASKNVFGSDLQITVELHGMKDRTLVLTDPRRVPPDDYTCKLDDLPYSKTVSVETMLAKSSELALENILWFFERFNWRRMPTGVIKNDQRRLLERRW